MIGRGSPALGLLAAAALAAACGGREVRRAVAPHEVNVVGRGEWMVVETLAGRRWRLQDVSAREGFVRGTTPWGSDREIPYDSIEFAELESGDTGANLALIPVAAVTAWLVYGAVMAPQRPTTPRPNDGSSCPFVYAHDGQSLVFQAEPFGGAIVPALERTEWTPLPDLRAVDGEYRIRIANELDETQHIDEARLAVVDHPAGTRVAADPYGDVHLFRDPVPPSSARDARGRDLTGVLGETDRRAWLSSYDSMDAGIRRSLRDPLVLEFPKPPGAGTARLLVNGATSLWGARVARDFLALRGSELPDWYQQLQTSEAELMTLLEWFDREGLYVLPIEVETPTGWEQRDVLYGSGPFAYKPTAYTLDISDLPGETLRLRLAVPVGFWVLNSIAVDYSDPEPVQVTELETTTLADDRGRELRALLSSDDDRALVLSETGDFVDVAYPVPPRSDGERTVFLKMTGYYEIHLPAEGDPDDAILARLLEEPGFTLQFAYERYLRGAGAPIGSP